MLTGSRHLVDLIRSVGSDDPSMACKVKSGYHNLLWLCKLLAITNWPSSQPFFFFDNLREISGQNSYKKAPIAPSADTVNARPIVSAAPRSSAG